jgi:hypothetical protein
MLFRRRSTEKFHDIKPGIEVIQFHHRFLVCWPSIHPDTGAQYVWYAADGTPLDEPPSPEDFPYLPEAWEKGLAKAARRKAAPAAPVETLEEPPEGLLAAVRKAAEGIAQLPPGSAANQPCNDAALKLSSYIPHNISAELVRAALRLAVDSWEDGHDLGYQAIEDGLAVVGTDKHEPRQWVDSEGAGWTRAGNSDSVEVTNSSIATTWLQGEIGSRKLAGFFRRNGAIVHTPRIGEQGYVPISKAEEASDGPAQLRYATADYISARVHLTYGCHKVKMDRDGNVKTDAVGNALTQPARFPETAAKDVMHTPDMAPKLRPLKGVVHAPVFRSDGSLVEDPGYDEETGLLYLPEAGLSIERVSPQPTTEEVQAAVQLINRLIAKFPFVTTHDKANWWGAMLTPLLRTLLPPPYKMIMMEAHQPGSGKTFLAEIIRAVFGGVFRSEIPEDEAELRKQISSILGATTGPVVVFDNISGKLRSSTLSGMLTSLSWNDRSLGSMKISSCENDRLWIGTGNNVSLGGDLPRRTIRVRIDPKMPNPERRTFSVDPVRWTQAHKGEVLHALLTIIRAWIAADMPAGAAVSSDSYGAWTQGVNGILKFAGIKGTFDHDMTQVQVGTDDDSWGTFYEAMYDKFGEAEWRTGDVFRAISPLKVNANDDVEKDFLSPEILPEELSTEYDKANGSYLSISQKLGRRLSERNGRWSSGFCVRVGGSKKIKKFSIIKYKAEESS